MDCKKLNNLRLVSALTLFVLLINFISIAIFMRPVEADNFHEIRMDIENSIQGQKTGKLKISFIPQSSEIFNKGILITIPDGFSDLSLNSSNFKFFVNGKPLIGSINSYDPFVGQIEYIIEDQGIKDIDSPEISFEIDSEMTNPISPKEYSFNVQIYDLGEDKLFGGSQDILKENGSVKVDIIKNDLVLLPEY